MKAFKVLILLSLVMIAGCGNQKDETTDTADENASVENQKANLKVESKVLSEDEISAYRDIGFKSEYPVFRAYEFTDSRGAFLVSLNEEVYDSSGEDPMISDIQAVCYMNNQGGLLENWRIEDKLNSKDDESTLWFWTKYCSFEDIDGDGITDPIIVYGTIGEDGMGTICKRRVNILLFYKGEEYGIRAIEDESDHGRKLSKDEGLKSMPTVIQRHLDNLIEKLRTEQTLAMSNG